MAESLEREIEGLRSLFRSERDPEGRAFVPLADAYRRNRDLDRALQLVSDGLEQHPDFASAHVVSAWIHRDRGDRDTARQAWERVLELDEENVEALRGLGTLLLESGRMQEARPYLEKARSLDPEDPDVPGFVAGVEAERPPVAVAAVEVAADEEPMHAPGFLPAGDESSPAGELDAEADDESTLRLAESLSASAERRLEASKAAAAWTEAAPDDESTAPVDHRGDADATVTEPAELISEPLAEPEPVAELLLADEPEPARDAPAPDEPARDEPAAQEQRPALEETAVVAVGGASLLGASEIMEVWSEKGLQEEEDSGPAQPPATRTMAELFARQGLTERAAEIYERLVASRPGDAELRARLGELRGQVISAPIAGVHDDDTEAIAQSWTAVNEEPTHSPFGWAPQEAASEETERAGAPISNYFGRLLAWEPGIVGEQAVVESAVVLEPPPAAEPEVVPAPVAAPAVDDRVVVPIESLAPDHPVAVAGPDPARAVPISSLAPDAVPIESLAPDAEPPHLGSTIQF